MSQDFQEVTLNTEISQGLDLLQKRDLTAATRSDSQTTFPISPAEGRVFNHSGEKQVYVYTDSKWHALWNYEFGAPYTIKELDIKFQPLHENLTNMSEAVFSENTIFAFPQLSYKIAPKWLREFGKCEDKNEFNSLEELKDIAFLNTINGEIHISESTIPPSAFEKDLETEVPREMSTGCIKRTFAPTWDQTKWILCDGSTIGSSVSNAKFRGNSYKSLFLSLGGTEGMWNSGQTISVPDFCGETIIVGGEKFSEETLDFSFGFEMELRYNSGYSNFENFTATKKGDVSFEIIGGGGGYAVSRWKSGGKSYARAASGGGGECAVGQLHLDVGDKITVSIGNYGTSGRDYGGAGGDSVIKFDNKEVLKVKGGSAHDPSNAGVGGKGGECLSEKITASFYRGHLGQSYFDVGVHHPRFMTGGSSGDPKNLCTDSPVGSHYAGKGVYVSATDSRRVGSGVGGILDSSSPPPHGGYCRISDTNGVLNQTENVGVIKCFFLIRT